MKRIRLRTALLNGVLLLLVGTAWFYLAPPRVGGFTTYVTTHGVSMEPHFHTGDLALVRPAGQYRVGDIVAYHSSLLHEIVLHRIVAIRAGRYTFKGDNNSFLDPVHPTRAQLVGKLWLHVRQGGVVLAALHNPIVVAVTCGLLAMFLLWGVGGERQRRDRRAKSRSGPGHQGPPRVSKPGPQDSTRPINFGAFLTASAVAVAVFLALVTISFVTPADKAGRLNTPYNQQVNFGYSAHLRPGPVYPNGTIATGDPIFLSLVHHLAVHVSYAFTSGSPARITGTEEILLELTGPSGWSRSFVLTPKTPFTGTHTSADVALNLSQMQSLMAQIERLTANPGFTDFSVVVQPVIHVSGMLGAHPVGASFRPGLTFTSESGQLQPSSGATAAGSEPGAGASTSQPNFAPSQAGSVSTLAGTPNAITVFGVSAQITLLRWISLIGLLVSVAATVLCFLRKRAEPFEETFRIQAEYGHMIVPIVAGEDLGWPPVDVPNIKALARLAEVGQRLILHNRSNDVDTYLVNDEGTVYRYQVRPSNVVWGEWSDTAAPVKAAA